MPSGVEKRFRSDVGRKCRKKSASTLNRLAPPASTAHQRKFTRPHDFVLLDCDEVSRCEDPRLRGVYETLEDRGADATGVILALTTSEFRISIDNPGDPVEISFTPADRPAPTRPAVSGATLTAATTTRIHGEPD